MATTPAGDPAEEHRHSRLAIGTFVLLLVLAIAVGVFSYRRLLIREEGRTEAILGYIADIQASSVSAWIGERMADASVFGSGKFIGNTVRGWIDRGAPDDGTAEQLHDQLQAVKNSYGYLGVAILDPGSEIRIATGQLDHLDPSATAAIRRAVETSSMQVTGIHGTPEQGQVVDIVTPLLGGAGDPTRAPPILLLRASADMQLNPFAEGMPFIAPSTQFLLAEIENERVMVVASSRNVALAPEGKALPLAPAALTALTQAPTEPFVLNTGTGGDTLTIVRKITGVPWYLLTMVDQKAIGANLTRLAWTVAGAVAGVLSLIGLALLFWWRQRESAYRLNVLRTETENELLQRRYDYLSKYANDMIVLTDLDGSVLEANDKELQVLGKTRDELIGSALEEMFWPESRPTLRAALKELQTRGRSVFEARKRTTNGTLLQVETSAIAMQFEGRRVVQLICRDITERKQAEAALRASQERLNGILGSILDIVWSFSPDLKEVNYINRSVERIYGFPMEAFVSRPRLWLEIIYPQDRQRVEDSLSQLSADHPVCDAEYRVVRSDGMIRWLHCRGQLVLDHEGRPARIDGVTTDITERKQAEKQVQLLAYYDSVTMLPNRRLLHDRLAQAMHMAARSERKVALLFMDLDNFKNINDSLGHHIGDLLLKTIAERLQQCVREEDTVARIGGDEFLVVLPDLERGGQAVPVAEKILATTMRPLQLEDQQIHTSISIGISVYPEDTQEPNQLIQHADAALYQAKSNGRNNYHFFTRELNEQIIRNSTIERQLRQAVDSGNLILWYQPQVDGRSGRLIGAEALLRWRRPDGSFISPVEFIPVAEERGLIGKIGEWVMREACLQSQRWQAQGLPAVPIAVNVSPIQFQQKTFAALVTGVLQDTRLDPRLLELEITESAIMRRASQVAELAMCLREVGVGISIDDFGTGYSSLSYLKQIPIDKIKIDRTFISDMLRDDDDEAITFAIVNLAHSLNLRCIAEGVESKEQVQRLRTFGCDEIQGNYYSSAVPAHVFETFMADGKMFMPDTESAK